MVLARFWQLSSMSLMEGFKVNACQRGVVKFLNNPAMPLKSTKQSHLAVSTEMVGNKETAMSQLASKQLYFIGKGCFTSSSDVTNYSLPKELSWRNLSKEEAITFRVIFTARKLELLNFHYPHDFILFKCS